MIHEESKYFCLSGDIRIGGPSTWHVVDWDQRRVVSVTMDGEQDDDDLAIQHYRRLSNQISPDTYRVYVSESGEIISSYTDANNDMNYYIHYPSLQDASLPEGIKTVRRNELQELDRLGPDVDLVAYPSCAGESAKKVYQLLENRFHKDKTNNEQAVFKYYFMWQYAKASWKEMNLWMRLPRHPNIVPFDRVVIDELEGGVVGFTNIYVPGGNLEENKSRVFKLKWLRQLIEVADELNLVYGISHQDIAPRNLVVDEVTDSIMLFDFNFAARINHPPEEGEAYVEARNDVKGVVFTAFEIITRNNSVRSVSHEDQNLDDLGSEWVKHPDVMLDAPIESYQTLLQEWHKRRAEHVYPPKDVRSIDWPSMPKPPQKSVLVRKMNGESSNIMMDTFFERRQDAWARGEQVVSWERPPQRVLDGGTRVLSTGEIITC
jgi:serine/threonine protein kinase